MAIIKTDSEINIMREGGKRLANILDKIAQLIKPGVSTERLNSKAEELIKAGGDRPSFLGYMPKGAARPYPAALCVSINDEVVHGIPNENPRILKEGDIVGLDLGLEHRGLFTDMAVTVSVGKTDKDAEKLINAVKEALYAGIKAARAGGTIGDIGFAVEQYAEKFGYGQPPELGGHGIGRRPAEEPYIPNFGDRGTGPKLKAGMVLAIEPMFNEGTGEVKLDDDCYTYRTADGKRSAHFEHTILVTGGKAEILTEF